MRIKLLALMSLSLIFLTGCIASNQMANDGQYYRNVGGSDCKRYNIVSPKKMACYDSDGNLTSYKRAMSDRDVLMDKMDDIALQDRMRDNNRDIRENLRRIQRGYYY